jgi:hypothetical protein
MGVIGLALGPFWGCWNKYDCLVQLIWGLIGLMRRLFWGYWNITTLDLKRGLTSQNDSGANPIIPQISCTRATLPDSLSTVIGFFAVIFGLFLISRF